MKRFKNNKYLFPLFLLLALVSCREEDLDGNDVEETDRVELSLSNEIAQVAITRVNDYGFCDGDGVSIYVVDYANDTPGMLKPSGNRADHVKYTFDEGNNRWIPSEPVYFKDKYTPVDIFGFYPYTEPGAIADFAFEVAKDQSRQPSQGKPGGYEASDFLWAKAERISPTATRIPLTFTHRLSSVVIELTEGTGFAEGEWNSLEKAALVVNTTRKASIDLSTGVVSPAGEPASTGTIPFGDKGVFRAIVVPQSVPAATPLFNLTVDGTPYVFRKNDVSFTYIPGKVHKFTISISKKSGSGLEFELISEAIVVWESDNFTHDAAAREYVVVDSPEGGKLAEAFAAKGLSRDKVKNLKVTGFIDKRDFDFMKGQLTALQSLNLKEVKITKYQESEWNGHSDDEIPNDAFSGKSSLIRFVFPDRLIAIGSHAFRETNLSGSLMIPEGLKTIGGWAFSGCSSLSGSLTFPTTLEEIGMYAFSECSGLIGNLNLPSGLKKIGGSVFQNCKGFTGSLILPEGLEELGSWVFYNASGFSGSLKIPAKITKIEAWTFVGCSGLNGQLILHNQIKEIGLNAFARCSFRGELNLPEEITIIGESAFSGNQFSGELNLPATLTVIGQSAFAYNKRFTGTVVIPDEIISIAPSVFDYCTQLEGIVLPKNIEAIRENAFANCYQLNAITCKAVNPPYLVASAFDGVAKDNFTVEVPEAAVANYQTAVNWNEFKRFSAYRDFSVSRPLFRTLNAADQKILTVRALSGANWKVESKPDWVTVSPESGTGKVEVTLTADALPKGAGNRDGEVVFLLEGKEYRVRTKVEQYDYQYGDGEVYTLQNATRGNGVNLVFMGDCFDAKDIAEGKYLDGVKEAVNHFFDVEPYKTYRDYFNVHVVFGLSPDSGIGSVNTIREARFGSAYTVGSGVAPDAAVCFEYACKAPINDRVDNALVTLVVNTAEYGGVCWMYSDGSAIAVCPMSNDVYPYDFRGIVQHEAGGHGFGKLGDEYIYTNAFVSACTCPNKHDGDFNLAKGYGWYDNLSLSGNMNRVPWSHFIYHPTYSDKVDIYEGGFYHTRGVFRSEPNSCMNNNIPYFSAVSRESIVRRLKNYAGESYSFDDFVANDVLDASSVATRAFSVVPNVMPTRQQPPVIVGEKPVFRRNR